MFNFPKNGITEDLSTPDIDAEEEMIGPIMERTVNLCRRIAEDCELSYSFPLRERYL